MSQCPEAEWKTRVDLAACYRLVHHYGMSDLTGTHISARVPGEDSVFLLNPYGWFFDEITASSLIKVNLDGDIVSDTDETINKAGFTIHSAVHAVREDVDCVIHTHTEAGMAVSCMAEGLLPLTQHSMQFYHRIGYHDYEGVATNLDERQRIQRDLGEKNIALVLRNHGLLTCGTTIAEAFRNMFVLNRACEAQVKAAAMQAGGLTLSVLPEPVVTSTTAHMADRGALPADRAWAGHLRRMDRIDPSYRH